MRSVRSGVVVLLLPAYLLLGQGQAQETTERVPSIRDIMQEAHRCNNAYIRTVSTELKREQPDWAVVESKSHALIRMGKLLGKNNPPRGSIESWRKLTDLYVAHATLLTDAAEKRDKEAALRHQRGLGMCKTCHDAHRPR